MSSEPLFERLPEINRAYEHVNYALIQSYRNFLESYGKRNADFIAGEITSAYESVNGKLSPSEKKALGGLFISLQSQGVIEKTGQYRQRDQGNVAAVYRLKA